jgi:hypothetical protein
MKAEEVNEDKSPRVRSIEARARTDAALWYGALERYNARPPDPCPYRAGTPEYEIYDRAWHAYLRHYGKTMR